MRSMKSSWSDGLTLGLALALALPVLALLRLEALVPLELGWAVGLPPVPDGGWSGDWGTSARTAAEIEAAAFEAGLSLLVALALVLWGSALTSSFLRAMREAASERAAWALRSAVGGTRAQLRSELLRAGLLRSLFVLTVGLLLAAVGAEVLGRLLPDRVVAAARLGPSMLLAAPVAGALVLSAAVLTLMPWLLLPGAAALRRPVRPAAVALRSDVIRMLAAGQVAAGVAIAVCAAVLVRGSPTVEDTAASYPYATDTLVLRARLPEGAAAAESWEAVRHALEREGVTAVSMSSPGAVLGLGTVDRGGAQCPGCSSGGMGMPVSFGRARHMAVDARFFDVLGFDAPTPLRAGDAVLDRQLARQWFQGTDPVGRRVWVRGRLPLLGDAHRHSVTGVAPLPPPAGFRSPEGRFAETPGGVYLALSAAAPREVDVVIRRRGLAGEPGAETRLTAVAAAGLRSVAPGGRVRRVGRLDHVLARQAAPVRWMAGATGALGAGALLFAVLGIAGAMVERVRARRPEIGLRMAVGASRAAVFRLVLGDAAGVVVAGAMVGGALGAGANRGLPAALVGLEPLGLGPLVGIVFVLAGVCLAGSAEAALRAARLDPVAALRG